MAADPQHAVTPKTNETFWVNLLGRLSAPTRSFRWCTERMKSIRWVTLLKKRSIV